MMSLLLRNLTNLIGEGEGALEIREIEISGEMMAVDDGPAGHLLLEIFQLLTLQGRNSTPAGNARLAG